MASIKKMLSSRYSNKINSIRDSISIELDECQNILENQGFQVKRSENLVNYEAAQSLTAEKGNIVFIANHFLQGGKELSIRLKHHGYVTTVPIFSRKMDEVMAVVNSAQYII